MHKLNVLKAVERQCNRSSATRRSRGAEKAHTNQWASTTSTNQHRIACIPSTDSPRPGLVVGVLPLPPTSLAQSGIVTDPCLTALSSVVGGRLRRPFACAPFSAPRLSPRGGATIALPFHGMISVYRLLNPCINESAGFIQSGCDRTSKM